MRILRVLSRQGTSCEKTHGRDARATYDLTTLRPRPQDIGWPGKATIIG